ncbi:MAG TPA: hypothetical protein VNV41_03895 [Candidatus Acidoferrales bacterium]|jgi:hypothetical protein|nr:hypothetical protein [Candidatus Acidoferrales bacterium]
MTKNAKGIRLIITVLGLGVVIILGALVYSLMPGLTMVRGHW